MDNTTNKITINNDAQIADWAKPYYNVQPAPTTPTTGQFSNATMPLNAPKTMPAGVAITPDSLKPTGQIKLPTMPQVNTTSAGVIGSTQPSIASAQEQYNQIQQATGTQAQDANKALQDLAATVFGQKSETQANQVNLENQAGLLEQQKALADVNTEIGNQNASLKAELDRVRNVPGQTQAQLQSSQNAINDTYGLRLANLAIRQSAANANISMIRDNAERQTKLLLAPLDNKIQYLSSFGKDNVDFLSKEQQNKLTFLTNNLESQKKDIEALQNAKTQMITEIAKNGGGTNQNLIREIQNASNIGEVSTLGAGSGYVGALDRQQLAIAKANLAINQAELKLKIDASKPIDVSKLVVDPNAPATTKNNAVMLALIKTGKVGDAAKTSLSSVLGVNKAIEDLANARQYTEFKGVAPIKTFLPSIDAFSSAEAIQNRGYLDAINLRVQQWASGASLTSEQIKQVNRLVPSVNDTDANVRTKMNNLANFMNQQVSGTLASQGIDFKPEKVNLFENRELYNKASPEQKAELDKIINQ